MTALGVVLGVACALFFCAFATALGWQLGKYAAWTFQRDEGGDR